MKGPQTSLYLSLVCLQSNHLTEVSTTGSVFGVNYRAEGDLTSGQIPRRVLQSSNTGYFCVLSGC